jgi:AraC family transcriptional regulator of adaptative response / DNA-3-methyladenine glycosylase II
VIEDFDRCYRAVSSRDPRFDGWFFTAVTSTGVYCRPSCPAMTPKRTNVRFYSTAAAAQRAGFRACKRCRPDATPGSPEWDTRADVVGRAVRLVADGVVDREGVGGLAGRLGYSTRQLERLLVSVIGVGPLALARSQRAQAARILVEATEMAMGDVAFAAGFSSIRQFNDTVRGVFAMSPSELRHRSRRRDGSSHSGPATSSGGATPDTATSQTVALRLPFRAPISVDSLFGHLAATSVPGVEEVRDGVYRRTLRLPHGPGVVSLRPFPDHIASTVTLRDVRDLGAAVARCRRLLDLDADPVAVSEVLGADPALGPLVGASPGRRVPRTVDENEMAVRAVLGQQVSIAAARAHAARFAEACGDPVEDRSGGLSRTFPQPDVLAAAVRGSGRRAARPAVPGSRLSALSGLVEALAGGRLDLGPGGEWTEARNVLSRIPGIGPWTVEMVAMRALGDPDAFPVGDRGLRRGAGVTGLPTGVADLTAWAERWRPWRAYATQYLWATLDHAVNVFPPAPGAGTGPARSVA